MLREILERGKFFVLSALCMLIGLTLEFVMRLLLVTPTYILWPALRQLRSDNVRTV